MWTAADVSNVTACQQSADSAGSSFLHKVGSLHDPQATWRASPTNGNSLSPSEERHNLTEKKNRRMGSLKHMIDTINYGLATLP